jgi:streptogramin lyase
VGHRGGLLGIYEPQIGAIKYTIVPEFRRLKISSIQCDTAGNMWFAFRSFSNNIAKWDKNLKRFKVYNDSRLIKKSEQESAIMITKQGTIWVQTFGNGIYRFDPVKEKIGEIYRDEQTPSIFPPKCRKFQH